MEDFLRVYIIPFLECVVYFFEVLYIIPLPQHKPNKNLWLLLLMALIVVVLFPILNVFGSLCFWLITVIYWRIHIENTIDACIYASLGDICLVLSGYIIEIFFKNPISGSSKIPNMHVNLACYLTLAIGVAFVVRLVLRWLFQKLNGNVIVGCAIAFSTTFTVFVYIGYLALDKYVLEQNIYRVQPIAAFLVLFIQFIFALVLIVILIRLVRKQEKQAYEKELFGEMIKYTSDLESSYQANRKILHDSKNIFLAIKEYIDKNDMEGITSFYNEVLAPDYAANEKDQYRLAQLSRVRSAPLKSIFYTKLIKAQTSGIEIYFEALDDMEQPSIAVGDLVRIVSNLLDNAIEESNLDISHARIQVGMMQESGKTRIIIQNKLVGPREDGVNFTKMYQAGYSSKGEGRGLGLTIVEDILKKYRHVNLDTQMKEENFVQILDIGQVELA